MSDGEIVTDLAAYKRRKGQVEPHNGRDPSEIIAELESLPSPAPIEQIQALTEELVTGLERASPFSLELRRTDYLRALTGKTPAPARLFDAARKATQNRQKAEVSPSSFAQGRSLHFDDPEAWPEPVDGASLLSTLKATFERYIMLADGASVVLALWVIHTFAVDASWVSPRLAITSPEKRCGKTRTLTLLGKLVAKPLQVANVSPAAIFRCVEAFQPTLLIDEADTFLDAKEELRGILNSGHQKDGHVMRVVGEDHEPRVFATFAPVAIAKIGRLPDTLADRSIEIAMRRKRPDEVVDALRIDRLGELEHLRRKAARWTDEHLDQLRSADPEVPPGLNDRAADNWRPLLAIAETAGGDWPTLALEAAARPLHLSPEPDAAIQSALLADVREIFLESGAPALFSNEVVEALVALEDRPWSDLRYGQPLTTNQLAKHLRPYGITPRQIRIGRVTRKGYALRELEDVFARYLPASNRNSRNIPLESTTYDDSQTETPATSVSAGGHTQTTDSDKVSEDVSAVSVCSPGSDRENPSTRDIEITDI